MAVNNPTIIVYINDTPFIYFRFGQTKSDMNSSTADELGYSVYYDEMAKFLSQKNLPSSELEVIIQNMWNSIDQLQKKIYHDKAKKGKTSDPGLRTN